MLRDCRVSTSLLNRHAHPNSSFANQPSADLLPVISSAVEKSLLIQNGGYGFVVIIEEKS